MDALILDTVFSEKYLYYLKVYSNPNFISTTIDELRPEIDYYDSLINLEFQYAQYLATPLEIKMFKSLNSFNAKTKFLLQFWNKIAKGRGDLPPITRNAYLARAQQANKRFKAMGKKGWETDQGRVFMIYSQPDEIERVPSESGSKPYEVWKYFKIENGVEFVFAEMGYGVMQLVHSTKRGELWDDNWMRYIK
jgi:GWxTD domain-containing protein